MVRCTQCKQFFNVDDVGLKAPMSFNISDTLELIELTYSTECPHCNASLRIVEPFVWTGQRGVVDNFSLFTEQDDDDDDD